MFLVMLNSCEKNKNYEFPQGEWVLEDFVVLNKVSYGYGCYFDDLQFESILNKNTFSYYGGKYLDFNSINFDKLKIIEVAKSNDSVFFVLNNHNESWKNYDFATNNSYKITLRTKKLKKLVFNYSLINDSTLIGEFWEKNQAISRYDAPNLTSINYNLENPDVNAQANISFKGEILGVYHLKK